MRVLKLVLPFTLLLSLLLGGHVLFPSGQVYASHKPCCMWCGQINCTPPGYGSCPWFACLTDDAAMPLAQMVTSNALLALKVRSDFQSSPLVRATSTDRLITLANLENCVSSHFILRFFQDDGVWFKPVSDFQKFNTSHNNLVAFQMGTHREK